MSNQINTELRGIRVSYARTSATLTGTPVVSGILRQNDNEDRFQSSFSFEAYDKKVMAHILNAADKIENIEASASLAGQASLMDDEPVNQSGFVSLKVNGYFKSRAPRGNRKEWRQVFIVESVSLVQS